MKKNNDTMWAIAYRKRGSWGFYTGTWLTRKDAIAAHINGSRHDWRWHVRKGDRAVKVTLTFNNPE